MITKKMITKKMITKKKENDESLLYPDYAQEKSAKMIWGYGVDTVSRID